MPASDARRLLDLLWNRYVADVPYARAFVALAGDFRNDHVAFRSLRRPGGGVEAIAPVFERLGWRRAGTYDFPDAHLSAIHLSHAEGLPRVFLSELRVDELGAAAQTILDRHPVDPPPPDGIDALAAWFGPPPPPREDDLVALEPESQYAAWVVAFGRMVNHFTAAVEGIDAWPERLRAAGVPMKAEIEGAPGSVLRQTATIASPLPVRLADGRVRPWPYAYLELAERRPGFDGFLGPQARQLFEMTRR